tara:strand:+ start:382 stop:1359 length:978 start_codon:yes stop_codon:yes gene_type:complete
MKLLWIIQEYITRVKAGAEQYTHNLNKYLISKGHEVIVLVPDNYEETTYEGVKICTTNVKDVRDSLVEWSEIILTHLGYTELTLNYINTYRPVIYVSHNTLYEDLKFLEGRENVSIIYNSQTSKSISPFTNNAMVLTPPQILKRTVEDANKNRYITLINYSKKKGGELLKKLSEAMPTHKFMAVGGGYDEQIKQPECVLIRQNTKDISKIYEESRIVLMPSEYESWGMVGSEAMTNGIPVIASDCFGLKENLGSAGIFCELEVEQWMKAIKLLDNPLIYKRKQEQALMRANELMEQNERELKEAEIFIQGEIDKYKDRFIKLIYR